MLKAKKYDWKDSNMALFGSDTEKKVKKESAETEPAWEGAGQEVGIQIWRINKFKVEHWDKEQYGHFFSGDSYIILNTYKNEDEEDLKYDVHFWIGKYSTQDEYGTAAYKTVELDTLLDDKPVQHREVQFHESELFKGYFSAIIFMKGGADTGFNHVNPTKYTPRLLHISGEGSNIEMREVSLKKGNLNDEDVFILDNGLTIYQYNGPRSRGAEKFKAKVQVDKIQDGRGKAKTITLENPEAEPEFLALLKDESPKEKSNETADVEVTKAFRISDASGSMEMTEVDVPGGKVTKDILDSNDVFIVDKKGGSLYVWCGQFASPDELKNWCAYSHKYLCDTPYPFKAVTAMKEGKEPAGFFD